MFEKNLSDSVGAIDIVSVSDGDGDGSRTTLPSRKSNKLRKHRFTTIWLSAKDRTGKRMKRSDFRGLLELKNRQARSEIHYLLFFIISRLLAYNVKTDYKDNS